MTRTAEHRRTGRYLRAGAALRQTVTTDSQRPYRCGQDAYEPIGLDVGTGRLRGQDPGLEEPVAAGFRRAQHTDVDPYATAVWLRLGERSGEARPCEPYDPHGFAELLPTLRKLTLLPDRQAFTQLQQTCATVGVAVEFEPDVKGSRACGAARWLTPSKAMILLSGRYRYHDSFWFSFFHESAHLLLHPRRKTVVHIENSGDNADGQEGAADDFAAATLIPAPYAERLTMQTSAAQARQLASDAGVHPGIVAGRLGHLYGDWRRYARMRRSLEGLRD